MKKILLASIYITLFCLIFASCNSAPTEIGDQSYSSNSSENNSSELTVSDDSNEESTDSIIDKAGEARLKINFSTENGSAITKGMFYASDSDGYLYRVLYTGDMSILSEGIEVYVQYSEGRLCNDEYTSDEGSWKPRYEVTATYVGLIARTYAESSEKDTVIVTDKNQYGFDDRIIFEIIAKNETDRIIYGNDFFVQHWDEHNRVWSGCNKEYSYTEEAYESYGKGKIEFTFSDRCESGYKKYRIAHHVIVNYAHITVYSNEFSVSGLPLASD